MVKVSTGSGSSNGISEPEGRKAARDQAEQRKARLAEQLRANLAKRKAQVRSRRTGQADLRPEGIGASEEATGEDKGDD